MALPKIRGDNPTQETIIPDEWVLVAENVNKLIINDIYPAVSNGWYTYLKTGDAAPVDFEDVPRWRINDAVEDLTDSDENRDWYIWAVENSIEVVLEISGVSPLGRSDAVDVVKQSNTKPWNDFYFVQQNGVPTQLTAAVPTAGDTRILTVASIADISIGDWIGVFSSDSTDPAVERYYWSFVEDINGLDLTMDTLIDYTFQIGSTVISTTRNMAVDGSVTPQIFAIQAGSTAGTLEIDISRVMLGTLTNDPVDLSKFCDIAGGLARPFYMRVKENGIYRNKISVKNNFDLALFAYDWQPYSETRPNEGQNGFNWRFSIGGEDKHDAVSRVSGGDIGSLQWIVQSNLSTILLLESVGANSEVTPGLTA